MTQYLVLNQSQFVEAQSNNGALEWRIDALESVLWYARDQLIRRQFTTVFEDIIDRIDAVLPSQLTQDISEWCEMYDKRVVMVDTPDELKFEAYTTVVTAKRCNGYFVSASVPPLDNIPMDSLRERCPLPENYEWSQQTAFSAVVVQRSNHEVPH